MKTRIYITNDSKSKYFYSLSLFFINDMGKELSPYKFHVCKTIIIGVKHLQLSKYFFQNLKRVKMLQLLQYWFNMHEIDLISATCPDH